MINTYAEKGYQILPGVLSSEEADAAAADIESFYASHPGSRVVNLHMRSLALARAITKQSVYDWVAANCFDNPVVYTTLSFLKGTQQDIHRDVPHFFTWPLYQFIGVWYALEDTDLNNGCLRYYAGGHKSADGEWFKAAKAVFEANGKKDLSRDEIETLMNAYQSSVTEYCEEDGCKIEHAVLKKGDCIIWHPLLPHGGSIIKDPNRTRKSIVAHCVPNGTNVYNARQFFNPKFDENTLGKKLPNYLQSPDYTAWKIQKQPDPRMQDDYV